MNQCAHDWPVSGGVIASRRAGASSRPWNGQTSHAQRTSAWLSKVRTQCSSWISDGLPETAVVALLDSLPGLARRDTRLFEASVALLRAQSSSPTWRTALNQRLAMVRQAVRDKSRLAGDALVLAPRQSSWRAVKNDQNVWLMHDGRTLDQFLADSTPERAGLWRSAAGMPGLNALEIPSRNMGTEAWAAAFERTQTWLLGHHPVLEQARVAGRTWGLALRRVERARIRGVYDPITQTVVVDPRHPDTLIHELAHWALGHTAKTGAVQAEHEVARLLEETECPA